MAKAFRKHSGVVGSTLSDRLFRFIVYSILMIFTIVILFPLINIVAISFSSYQAVARGTVWLWPKEIQLETYKAVLQSRNIIIGYRNSLFYTVVGTCINLVVTICAAYPLAFSDLKGRDVISGIFAFTMLFSGGMVPTYIVVQKLGLLNTVWSMLLPGALSVWNMVIMRTFFQGLPRELYEAANMDGCSDLRYLLAVVLPLSGSILAVIALYYAVGHWNGYFNAMLYLHNNSLYPLQIFLRDILLLGEDSEMKVKVDQSRYAAGTHELIKYAVIVIASAPMMFIYVFIQKYFVKGVMIGAVKG
ncbi:MAG: carbohydrate ABC transporter permease [Christensenellales bacterium]|jgi:putative aldouronate transport system permease protein